MKALLTLELKYEHDVVSCRQRVRQVAELLFFDRQDQTRIATAVSEITRNAFEYAGGGKVEFALRDSPSPMLLIAIKDSGPGIADLRSVLNGQYVSKTGMGLGILGARRLMEHFEVHSEVGTGTKVVLGKPLPKKALPLSQQHFLAIVDELARLIPQNPFEEVQQQNQELLRALEELRDKQAELAKLNQELEETNRGVVALYAELDEKAQSLKRANEAKTSFLANMTHEFRTPLNSILSLSQATLSEWDAALDPEHKKQVTYIRKSAETLSELVNDLLDIAKVEAGRIEVRPSDFHVSELFGGLRGVLRPLISSNSAVKLDFDEPLDMPLLHTDEGRLAQILRNLISNALKYTERGEVHVSASQGVNGFIYFTVSDTGIGIAASDRERIFDEFVQIENPLQKKNKGTGLGLPLSRKLSILLGGDLTVESSPGLGSTFTVRIPAKFFAPESAIVESASAGDAVPGLTREIPHAVEVNGANSNGRNRKTALIIDDEEISRYLFRDIAPKETLKLIEAADGFEGIRIAAKLRPEVIFLDLQMPAMSGFYVLELLKTNPLTRDIPVIIHTAMTLTAQEKENLSRQVVAIVPKNFPTREEAKEQIKVALLKAGIDIGSPGREVTYA